MANFDDDFSNLPLNFEKQIELVKLSSFTFYSSFAISPWLFQFSLRIFTMIWFLKLLYDPDHDPQFAHQCDNSPFLAEQDPKG